MPIPLSYPLIGAAWALTFTFAVVALAWRRPRFDPHEPCRPVLSMHPPVLASIKVGCVVAGHIAAGVRGTRPGAEIVPRKREASPAQRPSADRATCDDAGDGRLPVHGVLSAVR